MNILYNSSPERVEAILAALPAHPLTDDLVPQLLKLTQRTLVETLKKEIEIYKAFPKQGDMDKMTFDPTHNTTCFMGQGFHLNRSDVGDADLVQYREAVGTFRHGTWGNATLLEIWGGDHFDSHRSMVKGVFSYCRGDRKNLPTIKFYVLPLFSNKKSGRWRQKDEDRDNFLKRYLDEYNIVRIDYKLKPVAELEGDTLKEAMREWERYKLKMF